MSSRGKLSITEPRCIATAGDVCGEGVLWEPETACVFWTDINRFLVHRYTLATGEVKTWFFGEPVTGVMATSRKDTMALALGSGILLWKPESEERQQLVFRVPGWPALRSNDAAVDPRGSVWLGTMRNNVKDDGAAVAAEGWDGVLYRIDGDGTATEERRGLGIANTLVWNGEGSKFYFGDTLKNCLWSYEYDRADGSIRSEQSFFEGFDRGLPDGSAIDIEGYVWNCRYGGGCIVRVSPDGEIDQVIEMPVTNVTNCTFGGRDETTLFVTTAASSAGRWERLAGSLFALETNVAGVRGNSFKIAAQGHKPAE